MQIKVWGCRGSLPTPGQGTVRYGGNTTCLEIRLNDGTLVVVDAGSGIRALGDKLLQAEGLSEMYLFLTHAHWDHLMGFPFFGPAYWSRYRIHVRGGPRARQSLERYLKHQMGAPFFPVPFGAMKARFDFAAATSKRSRIGAAEIELIPLSHPGGGYGLKLIDHGRGFVFLTDNELGYAHEGGLSEEDYVRFCESSDLLIHDAQYTEQEYATKPAFDIEQMFDIDVL